MSILQEAYQGTLKDSQEHNPVDNQRYSKNKTRSKQLYFLTAELQRAIIAATQGFPSEKFTKNQ